MTSDGAVPSLLSVEALASIRGRPDVRIVDARFKMPGIVPTAAADYLTGHVPGASFFDIDRIAADDTPLPHMLPSADRFADAVGGLGIGHDDWVVLYDAAGIAGAARAWWMFRTFGHRRLSILDGGLRAWRAAGQPIDSGAVAPEASRYLASFNPHLVRSSTQILDNIATGREQVIDARAAGRFEGKDAEPWPGRRCGHIPGSLNLDHTHLIDRETGLLRPPEALRAAFAASGLRLSEPIVTTCGSGVTACVLAFGLHLIGHEAAVFDGSWAEWGLGSRFPIETGPAKIS
jgi:thiosulfate/3-mercaptopyruvate sulfurtransferase